VASDAVRSSALGTEAHAATKKIEAILMSNLMERSLPASFRPAGTGKS
jgi:hypothetical protein